jgi:hypothetical protein
MTQEQKEELIATYFDILQLACDIFREKNLHTAYSITKTIMRDINQAKLIYRVVNEGFCENKFNLVDWIYKKSGIGYNQIVILKEKLKNYNGYRVHWE